jgi:hypothetical protein
MRIPLRITHTGSAGRVRVQITRTDIAPGEPQALTSEHTLYPGEATTFQLYSRSAIVITEESALTDEQAAA